MFNDLLKIAWGPETGMLNQAFSLLLIFIVVIQIGRFLWFWDRLNQWSRAFVEAKLAFDNENAVKLKSSMDELQPPHSASSQLWILIPPVLIMMGLIGTFIGLTLALARIPFSGSAAEIQEGVKLALPSMGSAFWTSLSAICCSLMIRLTTMFMEAMFKSRVLKSIVSADPQLIQYIERRAFLENKPGALLRPHSLREVLWQQNIEFTRQLERLGSEISSAIRELPFVAPISGRAVTEEFDSRESVSPESRERSSSGDIKQTRTTPQTRGAANDLDASGEGIDVLLAEMRKQTALLEQLVVMQSRAQSAQRLERATQTQLTPPDDIA